MEGAVAAAGESLERTAINGLNPSRSVFLRPDCAFAPRFSLVVHELDECWLSLRGRAVNSRLYSTVRAGAVPRPFVGVSITRQPVNRETLAGSTLDSRGKVEPLHPRNFE